jgi:hypothetical protein
LAWLHLAVLWTFAVAQPLFDILADSPEFFVARGNTRADILIFSIGLVLVPPTAMVLLEALARPVPAVRRALHLLFVAGLTAAFALQLLDDLLGGSSEVLIAGAGVAGLLGAAAYARVRAAPAILTVLGPAPLIFLLLFLLGSPVSKLVLPQGDAESAAAQLRSDTPVVVVVFDEFDPNMLMNARQRIDRTRYPSFAAFAADSTWYRNATTVNTQTTQAVPALLDGLRPSPDRLPIAADHPNSLFTLFGESHELHVTETATEVCPERLCGGRARDPVLRRLGSLVSDLGIVSLHSLVPDGLRSRLPAVDRTFGDFAAGGRDEAGGPVRPDVPPSALRNRRAPFEALLRGLERGRAGRPPLHFVHVALPHVPWEYLPTGQQYLNNGPDTPGLDKDVWGSDPKLPRLALQRHLLQTGYVDRLLGRLVARLKDLTIYDRALVVITADHGVSYRAGQPRRAPTRENVSDAAAVPFFIKRPGQQRGRIDDSMVSTLDVVPTIAAELGADLPWKADGRAIREGRPPPADTVSVGYGASGPTVTIPFADFVRLREAGARRMTGLFGSGDGWRRVYATGPDEDLLGRPLLRLVADADPPARVELDSAESLDSYRPGARLAPSFVTGRIVGGLGEGARLAVAVNGVIAGVTQSFSHGDETRFAGMVPPVALAEGRNALEILAITGLGTRRRLTPLELGRPVEYRLGEDDGVTTISGAGRTAEVSPGRIHGFVELAELNEQGIRILGWAVDPSGPAPAERIVVFHGRQLVTQGRPTLVREDVAERYSDSALRAGFQVRGRSEGLTLAGVRVFAVSGDVATQLPLLAR